MASANFVFPSVTEICLYQRQALYIHRLHSELGKEQKSGTVKAAGIP